jgi:hypothetical protein
MNRLSATSLVLFVGTVCLVFLAMIARAATYTVQWGVLADAGTSVLMDSGVQNSIAFQNLAGNDAILCTAKDAGTNPALGGVCLLGSNDGMNFLQLGCSNGFAGPTNTQGFDPSTSAVAYYQLQLDAGGTVSGSVTCTFNNKGVVP